ncbi:hypothetical protein EJD97_015190, partial [Solanum chilense]
MPYHNLINVEFLIILGFVSRLHRDKLGGLTHPIYNNTYGIMLSPSLRKTNYEVHINRLPFPSRNLNNLSKTARVKMFCLNLLTVRTLGHIFCNVLLHAIPPIDLLKIMIHLGGTWMNGISGTMCLCNDFGLQIIHIWYTQPVLVPMYAVIS